MYLLINLVVCLSVYLSSNLAIYLSMTFFLTLPLSLYIYIYTLYLHIYTYIHIHLYIYICTCIFLLYTSSVPQNEIGGSSGPFLRLVEADPWPFHSASG